MTEITKIVEAKLKKSFIVYITNLAMKVNEYCLPEFLIKMLVFDVTKKPTLAFSSGKQINKIPH